MEQRKIEVQATRDRMASRNTREVAAAPEQPMSAAAFRLKQLYAFRQRQINYNRELEGLEGSNRMRRDAVMSGKLNWLPIGPAGVERGQADTTPVVSGRTKGIAIAPGGRRAYIASVGGGVWGTLDQGRTWTPLMDPIDYFATDFSSLTARADSLACGAIALVPGKTPADDKIFVGTGEAGFNMDVFMGVGPLVSSNGGLTWQRETANPSLLNQGFFCMVIDPDDPERVIAGTDQGVYVRDPGGTHIWNQQAALAGNSVNSIVVAKGKGRKVYYASVMSGGVFSSPDGVAWTPFGGAFPNPAPVDRITLAVHPNNPDVLYALVSGAQQVAADGVTVVTGQGYLHGAYRLDATVDNNWRAISGFPNYIFGGKPLPQGGQGWYDNTLVVSPDNENIIYAGGSGITVNGAFSSTINRCPITVTGSGAGQTVSTVADYIGNSVHADVHALVFAPNNPNELWACCDGGVFFTNRAKDTGDIFVSKNKGLQTLTINFIGTHPTQEEVLFCGVQDNGGLRYVGDRVWLHSMPGDGGYYIVNGANPFTVLTTYNNNFGRFSTIGGNRPAGNGYTYTNFSIPLTPASAGPPVISRERVSFYAPLAQVPFAPGQPAAQANLLAFGTQRPWISIDFGQNWLPLPSRTANNAAQLQTDRNNLGGGMVTALAFADSKNLLIGTSGGRIFKYTDTSAANDWSTLTAPAAALSTGAMPGTAVTDFAVMPGNVNQFFAAFGGNIGSSSHIWFYDGAAWHDRGGGATDNLLDVHFNAIAIDPNNPNHLYAGSDVGVWRTEDSSVNNPVWKPFSYGLPETAIIDLQFSTRTVGGNNITLLRAATYGRGVYECDLSAAFTPEVGLYLRDTILDRARYPVQIAPGVADPRNSANQINAVDTPDIKIDAPDTNGLLQAVSNRGALTPGEFQIELQDRASTVPVPPTGKAVSKVYVQVNNHGIQAADNIRVYLLLHEITGTLPALPAAYKNKITAGIPIAEAGWTTVGIRHLHGVSAGKPGIAAFDLSSDMLPAHASIPGGGKQMVLVALVHHHQDPYQSDLTVLDTGTAAGNVILSNEYKITFKRITVVQQNVPSAPIVEAPPLTNFVRVPDTATTPGAPYDAFLAFAFRQNDNLIERTIQSGLAAPFAARGNVPVSANPDPKAHLFADNIVVNAPVTAQAGIPVVWTARNKITISATLSAKGKGAADTGDFGGGGGSGSAGNPGKNCQLPRLTPALVTAAGGLAVNNPGAPADPVWASRAPLMLTFVKGGAAGGNDGANPGGLGGGVIVLCAPVIELEDNGIIDASGDNGTANAGGGGGGLIILIAREIIGLRDGGANPNVLYNGGSSSGSGGRGGNGLLLRKEFV